MDDSIQVPALSADLIRALDALYPERSADLSWPDREVWYRSGQRQVVRFLIEQHKRQNESDHVRQEAKNPRRP